MICWRVGLWSYIALNFFVARKYLEVSPLQHLYQTDCTLEEHASKMHEQMFLCLVTLVLCVYSRTPTLQVVHTNHLFVLFLKLMSINHETIVVVHQYFDVLCRIAFCI